MDIIEIKGRGDGYFKPKHFLSINEVTNNLTTLANQKKVAEASIPMIKNTQNVFPEEFINTQQTFEITKLQHVTTEEGLQQILESEGFTGRGTDLIRDIDACLSWWSADTSNAEPAPDFSPYEDGHLTKQFSESPAFNIKGSRYGNFKFSISFSDLLTAYQAQYCKGGEPLLKVMGTQMFKYEIAHVVLIHSPDTELFNGFPMVPCKPKPNLPVIYQKDLGKLIWTPESKGSDLYIPGRFHHCVWNHLIIAFHLPKHEHLTFPKEDMLNSVSACEAQEPFLQPQGMRKSQSEAEDILKRIRRKYRNKENDSGEELVEA